LWWTDCLIKWRDPDDVIEIIHAYIGPLEGAGKSA
jgi:hypothetical protein